MTRLFIENQEVELDKSVQFAITKQFEDLSNPTTIINDWSKTVSIPFTQKNNNLFGNIYKTDRLIVTDGTDKNTGIYFNPTLKMDFRLQDGDNVLMTGYAKMNEIKQKDGKGTYEITLFGELGRVLLEMQKITFDTTYPEQKYIINGRHYVEEYINKNLVASSWSSQGQTHSELETKYKYPEQEMPIQNINYRLYDIIGFAPNTAFSSGFDYKTVQASSNQSRTLVELLGDSFTDDLGIEPDTVISNGITPRGMGEFRSYNQLPFVYWNKLFQMFQKKAEDLTGYSFVLDSDWFNTNNPYWYNLVYMLKKLNTESSTDSATNYYNIFSDTYRWSKDGYGASTQTDYWGVYETTESFPLIINGFRTKPAQFRISNKYDVQFSWALDGRLRIHPNEAASEWKDLYWGDTNALNITVEVLNESDNILLTYKILMCSENYTVSGNYDSIFRFKKATDENAQYNFDINPVINFTGMYHDAKQYVKFRCSAKWENNTLPFILNGQPYGGYGTHLNTFYFSSTTSQLAAQINNRTKSNSYFTFNDLWNNEYNLFDEILKYCKSYHIKISVDDLGKKIYFQSSNKYFENYEVVDWTNKVDFSRDFVIKPIAFDSKYVLFNYKDSEVEIGKSYKTKYGVNFGDYRLTTNYNFNDETTNLFKEIKSPIVYTESVLSWLTLNRHKIFYSFPNEIYVANRDKDNKEVDIFGTLYFHNGLKNFNRENSLHLVIPKISDDSTFQRLNNTYFYTFVQSDYVTSFTYPFLDVVYNNNICTFNVPSTNFTYNNNYSGKNSIYELYWKNYLDERYNIQNKKVTCYIKLTPLDWINFKFNKFVKIDNQLYIVNKIYDYDITSTQPTKVDLITIQDVTGYTN